MSLSHFLTLKTTAAAAVILFALANTIAIADPKLDPLPISPLWKSPEFQKAITGSYGIDSRIEPVITVDEGEYLADMSKLMADEDREGAIKLLEGASISAQSPALLFTLANLYFENGDVEKSIEKFREALKNFPNFRDARRNLAVVLIENEDIDEARKQLIRAVELGADDGLTLGLLGYCHATAENYQSSLQSYRLAQITMPDELQWKMGEAVALQQTKQIVPAIALYREILKTNPTDVSVWRNLAYALQQNKEETTAISAFEVLGAFSGLGPSEALTLGHLYLNNELPGAALVSYTTAFQDENRPALASAITALRYLSDTEHWSESGKLIEVIVANYPTASATPELIRVLALVNFESGKQDEAIATIRELVNKDPLDGQAIITLGKFHQTRNELIEAEMVLEQAALLDEHAADALLQLGRISIEKGDYEKAVERIERSQTLKPRPSVASYLDAARKLVGE